MENDKDIVLTSDTASDIVKTPKTHKLNKDVYENWKTRITSRSETESRGQFAASEFAEKESKLFPNRKNSRTGIPSFVYRNIAKLTAMITGTFETPPQKNYTLLENVINAKLSDDKKGYFHYSTPNYSLRFYAFNSPDLTAEFYANDSDGIDPANFLETLGLKKKDIKLFSI